MSTQQQARGQKQKRVTKITEVKAPSVSHLLDKHQLVFDKQYRRDMKEKEEKKYRNGSHKVTQKQVKTLLKSHEGVAPEAQPSSRFKYTGHVAGDAMTVVIQPTKHKWRVLTAFWSGIKVEKNNKKAKTT